MNQDPFLTVKWPQRSHSSVRSTFRSRVESVTARLLLLLYRGRVQRLSAAQGRSPSLQGAHANRSVSATMKTIRRMLAPVETGIAVRAAAAARAYRGMNHFLDSRRDRSGDAGAVERNGGRPVNNVRSVACQRQRQRLIVRAEGAIVRSALKNNHIVAIRLIGSNYRQDLFPGDLAHPHGMIRTMR